MTVRRRPVVLAIITLAFLWANLEAFPHPNGMSNLLLAYRFVTEGSARITGFDSVPAAFRDWQIRDGFPEYGRFGPGTAVALTPAVGLAIVSGVRPADILAWGYLDKAVATTLVVIAALATYAAARRFAGDGPAVLATFATVAGTALATIVSQRTWQHALAAAAVAIAWLLFVRSSEDERWSARAGLPLALAITARYPLAIFWFAGLAYVALARRKMIVPFLGWSAGPLLFLAIYNAVVFGSPAESSYGPQIWQWADPMGLPGILISPSRGLFVFSPFLVAGLLIAVRGARRRHPLWLFALASFVGLWLVHGTYIEWWGGFSYGERYLVETVPILASGVALFWRDAGVRARWALVAAIAFAVVLQVAGLLAYYRYWDGYNWDAVREQFEGGPAMWDLSDTQWWWTIRAAIATADVRTAILVPVTALFAFIAFRAGVTPPRAEARPAA